MIKLLNDIKRDLEAGVPHNEVQYYYIGKPVSISQQALDKGVIVIKAIGTKGRTVTTGVREEDTHTVRIEVMKTVRDKFVNNAQVESGDLYLTRVIDDRNEDGSLKPSSIRYIIRNKMRAWGIMQGDLDISYDEPVPDNYPIDTVAGAVTLTQLDIVTQSLA